jgi:type II secretory pathway pseudopilin PulG
MRRRLGEETGSALVAAMITMLIAGVLAGTAVATSLNTNQQSRDNVAERQAAEAAEAGLQVALYRWNMLLPSSGHCVGDAVASPAANGTCASSVYSLGNHESYQYWTTPALAAGASCVGNTVSNAAGVTNICITAVGTSGTVSARSEIRAAGFSAQPLFPYPGITGLAGITNAPNTFVNGTEASNLQITASDNATITGNVELGPGGSYSAANGASHPTQLQLSSPIVLSPVAPGTSATVNDDYRITNYLSNPASPTAPYDPSSGVSFNPVTRALSLANNASLTLTGGIYNFCSFSAQNNATITLAASVRTEIIIDSPQDTGSGCPSGSGTFFMANNATWSNPTNDPTALQIYVYGPDTGSNEVTLRNNGVFYGVLYAPTSTVELSNNGTFHGAIAGKTVTLDNNFSFAWSSAVSNISAGTNGLYYRTAWAQCQTAVPAANPMSNCG